MIKRIISFFLSVIMLTTMIAFDFGYTDVEAATYSNFQQFLADYNLNYNRYSFWVNEFKSPYRSYVETKKNSSTYQVLLNAWRVATFTPKDDMEYAMEEVAYYQTILFDILYEGEKVESITGRLDKDLKLSKSSLMKTM